MSGAIEQRERERECTGYSEEAVKERVSELASEVAIIYQNVRGTMSRNNKTRTFSGEFYSLVCFKMVEVRWSIMEERW